VAGVLESPLARDVSDGAGGPTGCHEFSASALEALRDDPLHQSDVRGIAQLVEATTINADLLAFFEE
jgi:hypothetical protein